MFSHELHEIIPLQPVADEDKKSELRQVFRQVQVTLDGGTAMYTALQRVISEANASGDDLETWIVCLTDGASTDKHIIGNVSRSLVESPDSLNIIVVGINLGSSVEEEMRSLCSKYGATRNSNKGIFLRSEATIESLNQAFQNVSQHIPVSGTFELDGDLSDDDCRMLISEFAPDICRTGDMQRLMFWTRFLFRRVSVFDKNESFNYNETIDNMGSSLMKVMLLEVERLLDQDHSRDWGETNYSQLIYDFTDPMAPEFRLLCTSPDQLDENDKRDLESLQLPGFSIPSESQTYSLVCID